MEKFNKKEEEVKKEEVMVKKSILKSNVKKRVGRVKYKYNPESLNYETVKPGN